MRSLLLRKGRERPSTPRAFASARRAHPTPPEVGARPRVPGTRAFRTRRRHAIAAVLALFVMLRVGYVTYCIVTIPSNGGLVIEPTPSALIVEAADGQIFATRGVFKGDKLAAQDVPTNLSRAIVAIEDRHFYEHGGFFFSPTLLAARPNTGSR